MTTKYQMLVSTDGRHFPYSKVLAKNKQFKIALLTAEEIKGLVKGMKIKEPVPVVEPAIEPTLEPVQKSVPKSVLNSVQSYSPKSIPNFKPEPEPGSNISHPNDSFDELESETEPEPESLDTQSDNGQSVPPAIRTPGDGWGILGPGQKWAKKI